LFFKLFLAVACGMPTDQALDMCARCGTAVASRSSDCGKGAFGDRASHGLTGSLRVAIYPLSALNCQRAFDSVTSGEAYSSSSVSDARALLKRTKARGNIDDNHFRPIPRTSKPRLATEKNEQKKATDLLGRQ
jgi:hypothetical protein